MNIDIGSKIKTLRLSKSMTQEQLAKSPPRERAGREQVGKRSFP